MSSSSPSNETLTSAEKTLFSNRSRLQRKWDKASALVLNTLATCAGSSVTFVVVICLVLGWAISAAWVSGQEIWQISMQDVSSIGCYLWDITLLFAQQQDNRELARQIALLQASGTRQLRLLCRLAKEQNGFSALPAIHHMVRLEPDPDHPKIGYRSLPQKSWYDRWADAASELAGSPFIQAIYWAGIVAWLALGRHMGFGDNWQLDANTATAVELMVMTTFLQNTKRRHRSYMHCCSALLAGLDQQLEERLVAATKDCQELHSEQSTLTEPVVPKQQTSIGFWKRHFGLYVIVDRYANFIGSIGGICLSIILLAIWLVIGSIMGYGNANWWLIIGTYTGLAGFIDAFVLRNCMRRQTTAILQHCDALDKTDQQLAAVLRLPQIAAPDFDIPSFFGRISHRVGQCAGHILAVFLAGAVVIALLVTATAMSWTTTAQLLCNTPTMIIEGGMLLVLMMAHMASHQYMRARLQTFLQRRVGFQAAFDCQHINLQSLPVPMEKKAEQP